MQDVFLRRKVRKFVLGSSEESVWLYEDSRNTSKNKNGGDDDPLMWCKDLEKHYCGDFSFATVQANQNMEAILRSEWNRLEIDIFRVVIILLAVGGGGGRGLQHGQYGIQFRKGKR